MQLTWKEQDDPGKAAGMETTQCYLCQGDEADPYGELDDVPAEFSDLNQMGDVT
jgi:hypothetical protein